MNQKTQAILKGLLFLSIFLLSSNFVAAVKISDDLPSDASKGYLEFFDVNGWTVSLVREGAPNQKFPIGGLTKEYRIAEAPGTYTFIAENSKYSNALGQPFSRTIKVNIEANTIIYVSLISSFDNAVSSGSILTSYYSFDFTVGKHLIPVKPDETMVHDLLDALDDDDLGTRDAALVDLEDLLSKNPQMDTKKIIAKIKYRFNHERFDNERNKLKDFLTVKLKQKVLSDNNIIIWDGFTGNQGLFKQKWPTITGKSYFNADGYNYDQNNDGSDCVFNKLLAGGATSFDLLLTCTWKSGVSNHGYGFFLGQDDKNYYYFWISKDGWAMIGLIQNNNLATDPLPWQQVSAIKSNTNILTIQVRNNTMTYFINGSKVGVITNDAGYDYKTYGLIVDHKQGICFNLLRILKTVPKKS